MQAMISQEQVTPNLWRELVSFKFPLQGNSTTKFFTPSSLTPHLLFITKRLNKHNEYSNMPQPNTLLIFS